MGKLSRKLFRKQQSVPMETAKKIGVETYMKRREKDINQARFDMLVIFATFMHNDYHFGAKRLSAMLRGLIDLLIGIKHYSDNDPIIDMQDILKNEAGFDMMKFYNDYVSKKQGVLS